MNVDKLNGQEVLPRESVPFDRLEIDDVTTGYSSLSVVSNVSLSVHVGEVVLLTGHNGAGKSCLVETIFGLVPLKGGRVIWSNEDVSGKRPRALLKRGVVLVPQGGGIVKNLTVWENMELVAPRLVRNYVRGNSEAEDDFGFEVLNRFSLISERRDQIAGSLSGGEQRIVSIVRALLRKPRILIIDEPFLGLSGLSSDVVLDLIDYLRNTKLSLGVLIVEQQLFRLVGRLDRYYVMRQGRIERKGQASELWALSPEELWSLS